MNFFIQNFKAQTLKSIVLTILITSVVVYLYWSLQSLQSAISIGILWDGEYFYSFVPLFIEIVVYVLGLTFLVSRKGWMHGAILGLVLVTLMVIPDFINYAFHSDGSLTFLVAILIIVNNFIQLSIPGALLAHLRKN
jgi:hypothetical protein